MAVGSDNGDIGLKVLISISNINFQPFPLSRDQELRKAMSPRTNDGGDPTRASQGRSFEWYTLSWWWFFIYCDDVFATKIGSSSNIQYLLTLSQSNVTHLQPLKVLQIKVFIRIQGWVTEFLLSILYCCEIVLFSRDDSQKRSNQIGEEKEVGKKADQKNSVAVN